LLLRKWAKLHAMSFWRLRVVNTGAPDLSRLHTLILGRFGSAYSYLVSCASKTDNGHNHPIPMANDVNRDEALLRTPIPAANGASRYEAIISISEELRPSERPAPVATESHEQNQSSLDSERSYARLQRISQVIQADLVRFAAHEHREN